jgi:O-acetyl-ADP-ribose deacetylase
VESRREVQVNPVDRIALVQGDIVDQPVDAVVNAANSGLRGGGGVDGAIHRAAGPGLLEECEGLGGCRTGDAMITRGHRLRAGHVIHAVGPVWRGGGLLEANLLARCYWKSLKLCEAHALRTVAFPAISTGAYRYPLADAARIALRSTLNWLGAHPLPEKVVFVLFTAGDLEVYRKALAEIEVGRGMPEAEFWGRLENRVCRELAAMPAKELRALWCDGFVPVEYLLDDPAPRIAGRAWIGRDGQGEWEFTLLLPRPAGGREEIDWASLLPAEDMTGWLDVEQEGPRPRLTIDPSRAVPGLGRAAR